VETRIDLNDRSEWIMVQINSDLCELHNEDVGILCESASRRSCGFWRIDDQQLDI
jgi:hypothetical protein